MLFEEASRDPLVNSVSDVEYQIRNSGLIFLSSSLYSFKEELNKALQRVLIHMVNNA